MERHEFEEMFRQVMKEHYPELSKEPERKRWRARNGVRYWYVHHDGLINYNHEDSDIIDTGCYNLGNYFKTESEAGLHRKKLLITQKVKDIASRLGEPTEDEFSNSEIKKYFLVLKNDGIFGQTYHEYYKTQGAIYCLDENFLDVCLEEIGEEDLKLIFT